jgi:MFS transporter, PPP family, 3-phenylpropionic acid transporter
MAQLNPANVNDPFAPRLALAYAAIFLAAGWQLPFLPVWLAASGLDPAAIGIVLAASQATRVVATPASTRLTDRFGTLRGAIATAALAAVVAMALVANARGFGAILAAIVVYALVSAPIMPLVDAYALKGLGLRGRAYGPVRLWGSVAFIVANLAGGVLFNILVPGNLIWLIFSGNCAVAIAALALVPVARELPPPEAGAPRGHSHLRRPAFLAIAAAGSLVQASHAVYYGFSTLDWTRQGYDGTTIGVLWALGVVAEIVLFALAGRLPQALGPAALIGIGAAGAVARWTALAFDPPAVLMAALQLLHALSFGATHLGTMLYLSRAAPEGSRAAMQGDVATANSVMMAAASVLSGVLYGIGGSFAYAAMAALALAGGGFAVLSARLTRVR